MAAEFALEYVPGTFFIWTIMPVRLKLMIMVSVTGSGVARWYARRGQSRYAEAGFRKANCLKT